ncbi:MAG: intradiol ring-cleavage dioxygenase [Alphaproteobacteria bacterium]|nr:intradiol ring-cleavage dioxygenase [Alphaproteobacteria bacterium]
MHDDDSRGLANDLARMTELLDRRQVLTWFAAAAGVGLVGCESEGTIGTIGVDTGDWDTALDTTLPDSCADIPEETAGPYPGDGSNGPNALTLDDIVRSDIRTSIGSMSGTAAGVVLRVRMRILDAATCTPLAGHAVYLWHCTQDGKYSLYTDANQNYLRGVQVTDDDGWVQFTTIYPGCYSGRWPHIHFEVYASLAATSSARNTVATSQIAMPEGACDTVFASSGYEASVSNFARITLASDNVFSDGASLQTPSISGSVDDGYAIALDVAV